MIDELVLISKFIVALLRLDVTGGEGPLMLDRLLEYWNVG